MVRKERGVDQLRVETKLRAGSADAAFQNMRHPQFVTDLPHIPLATVIHDTRPADDFQVDDLRQLGQNVVLHAISKGRVLFLIALSSVAVSISVRALGHNYQTSRVTQRGILRCTSVKRQK
jgi:hypothetical protein